MSATPGFSPFSLYVRTLDSTPLAPGPRYLCIRVDTELMDVLFRESAFADVESFSSDEDVFPLSWDGFRPDQVLGAPPVPVKRWRVAVDADTFVLVGKNGDIDLTKSRPLSISGLTRWLQGSPTDTQPCDVEALGGASSFRRVGPLLIHGPQMDDFIGLLERSCPEVQEVTATLLAASMTERIASTLSDNPPTPAAAARRSRRV